MKPEGGVPNAGPREPTGTVEVAIQLSDPAGLLAGPHHESLLREHHKILQDNLLGASAEPKDGLDRLLPGVEIERLHAVAQFSDAAQAVHYAVAVQRETQQSREARLQLGVAIADATGPEEERWKTLWPVPGGQILCDRQVYERQLATETTDERRKAFGGYEWDEAAGQITRWEAVFGLDGSDRGKPDQPEDRKERPVECVYLDSLRSLDEPFERMFAAEVSNWVGQRDREGRGPLPSPERPHVSNDLVGLALSGGGVRSAVFSLGVAQALAEHGVLKDVDYISTVSGGGYLGASLASLWSDKPGYSNIEDFGCGPHDFPFFGYAGEKDRTLHGNESPALQHVRRGANLLASASPFDPDSWLMAGRFLATTLLLWVVFLLPPITLLTIFGLAAREGFARWPPLAQGLVAGLVPLAFGVLWCIPWYALRNTAFAKSVQPILAFAFYAVAVGAVFLVVTLPGSSVANFSSWRLTFALSPVWLFSLAAAASLLAPGHVFQRQGSDDVAAEIARRLAPLAAELTVLLALLAAIWGFDYLAYPDSRLTISALISTLVVSIGGGATALTALQKIWTARTRRVLWELALQVGGYLALGFVLTAWCWMLWSLSQDNLLRLALLGGVSSLVFVVAFGGVLSFLGGWIAWLPLFKSVHRLRRAPGISRAKRVIQWLSDILYWLSPGGIYARLIEKGWGISAVPPGGGPGGAVWQEVWPRKKTMSAIRKGHGAGRVPYPLMCCAVNLAGKPDSKLPDRRADSFVIAPIYSGSAATFWLPTQRHHIIDNLSIAEAAAMSGAAIAPQMGERTTRTFSIITTLLNARLGRWIQNPRVSRYALAERAFSGMALILYWREMLGLAARDDEQVYLSDGGHFENLGLYELFRRRCRFIIAVTADSGDLDKVFELGNLGVAVRRARVDFGVEVEFKGLDSVLRDHKTGFVRSCVAAGRIKYPFTAGDPASHSEGVIVVISAAIVETDATADVLNYRLRDNLAFPYDSTADLQFDQAQFEAYRQLGCLAGRAVCDKASGKSTPGDWFESI